MTERLNNIIIKVLCLLEISPQLPISATNFVYILHACMLSCFSLVQLFAALRTVACQAPLPMGFSRQEYWSGLPFPPAGDLPNPGIEPTFLTSPALAGGFFTTSATWDSVRNSKILETF